MRLMRNALVVPTPRTWPAGVVIGGVFDESGEIVPESLLYRNFSQVVFAPEHAPEPVAEIETPHLYGGFCIDHFGHFLLEGLSRAWATERHPGMPLVWATPGRASAWQEVLCTELGFADRMQFLDGPTRFSELLIPMPGYRIRDMFHPDHAAFLAKATPAIPATAPRRIWLSRQGLGAGARIGGEELLEAQLTALGWTIVVPETHSATEQLALLAGAEVIASTEGSALHLPVLLKDLPGAMIVLRRFNNENYQTISRARGFRMHDVIGSLEHAPVPSGPVHHLIDPAVTATLLHEIAEREAEGSPTPTGHPWPYTHYQQGAPRFAPHLAARSGLRNRSFARRLKRRILG